MNLSVSLVSAMVVLPLVHFGETPSVASGGERPKHVVLAEGEVHEGWFFAAGENVIIRGIVNGDAYVAGGTVEVDGVINGDLLVVGGNVSLRGSVIDDIRTAGGNLRIDGKVGKDVTAAGGNVEVGSASQVEGNVLAAGGKIYVGGIIKQKAKLAGGDITVTGTIEESADLSAEHVTIAKGARVGKDLSVRVRKRENVQVAEGTVGGELIIRVREEDRAKPEALILGVSRFEFWFKVYWTLSLLAVGLVFALAFPDQMYAVGKFIWGEPGKSLLSGLIGLVVVPVGIVALLISVIGVPMGLFLLLVYVWVLYLSQLSLGIVLGHLLFGAAEKRGLALFGAFAVGLIIIQGVTFIPVIKIVIVLLGLVLGMGAFLLLIKAEYTRFRTG
ncbi:MAG: hypothetical protein ACE5H0_01485 [Bacteroidota bacterium]